MPRRGGADRKVELLGRVPLFSECSQKELSRIASLADEIEVDKGAVLTKEGLPGRECFVVSEGKAKCTLRGKRLATYGRRATCSVRCRCSTTSRASATITAETRHGRCSSSTRAASGDSARKRRASRARS